MATTKEGSKFLQANLSLKTCEVISKDLKESSDLAKLMTDDYANYFLQKYIVTCSGD
jgi:hypothetical protein